MITSITPPPLQTHLVKDIVTHAAHVFLHVCANLLQLVQVKAFGGFGKGELLHFKLPRGEFLPGKGIAGAHCHVALVVHRRQHAAGEQVTTQWGTVDGLVQHIAIMHSSNCGGVEGKQRALHYIKTLCQRHKHKTLFRSSYTGL